MRTHARRDGSDWILNGAKMWITNGTIADIAIVWARTEDGRDPRLHRREGHARVHAPRRSTRSCRCARRSRPELVLDDVRVPDENMLPGVERSRGPLSCLNEAALRDRLGRRSARRAPASRRRSTTSKERIVFEQADRRLPAHRSRSSPRWRSRSTAASLVALHLGRMKDAGHAAPGARQPREDGQRPRRDRGLPLAPARSSAANGDHARVPGDPAHEQPRVRPHLRGHARGAHARRRPGADRREGSAFH